MVRSQQDPWDEDERHIKKAVAYWSRTTAQQLRLAHLDSDDVAQELILHLLQNLSAYDSRRSARRTFISRIVKNRALSLVEHHSAQMRDASQEAFSLQNQADSQDDDSITYAEIVGQGGVVSTTDGRIRDTERQAALRVDLSVALTGLSPELRQLAKLIGEGASVQEIARRLGVHRDTVDRRRAQLRERLRARGLKSGE